MALDLELTHSLRSFVAAVQLSVGAGALPDGATASGPVVRLGPEGLVFGTPITLTLPTTAAANAVYTRPNGGAWATCSRSTPSFRTST